MNLPSDLKYTAEHEWVKKTDDHTVVIGITDFAQSELGDIVYVEIETVGETLRQGEVFGTVEAVKTTSDLFMPVSGEILEFNPNIDEDEGDQPELINDSPYDDGWIIKIRMSDPEEYEELMDKDTYEDMIS